MYFAINDSAKKELFLDSVSNVFADADDDALTYTVTSSDVAAVPGYLGSAVACVTTVSK